MTGDYKPAEELRSKIKIFFWENQARASELQAAVRSKLKIRAALVDSPTSKIVRNFSFPSLHAIPFCNGRAIAAAEV
ncbi:MAG: hypothetical protein ACREEM_10855 [Blastocatellia bacterium]